MKFKKIIITGIMTSIVGVNAGISNVFAERIFLNNISGDFNYSDSYHYSTSEIDKEQSIIFTIDSKNVKINDTVNTIDEAPFLHDGTTLLPLRAVSDTLSVFGNSSHVNWNSETKKVIVNYMDKEIIFTQDSKDYTINGNTYSMQGSAPIVKNNRIFIPLRTFIEAMGFCVEWNEDLKEITIKL